MTSRSEALSFIVHKKIAFNQVTEPFVRQIGVDQSNGDIVITLTDGRLKRIKRIAGSGDPAITIASAGYIDDSLKFTLSNGEQYDLNRSKNPVDYQNVSGIGYYLGSADGIHLFKSIVANDGSPMQGFQLPIDVVADIPRSNSQYMELTYTGGNDAGAAAGVWAFRRISIVKNNIDAATVGVRSVRLPKGRYYIESELGFHRGGTAKSGLHLQTPIGDSPTTNTLLFDSNPSYGWETTGSVQGECLHFLRGIVELTEPMSQLAVGSISSSATSYMTWVWTGHITRIWKIK